MTESVLSRAEARRIAIRAQMLDAERPTELLPVVEQLGFLQLDPTAAIAPSADLISWSRIGSGFRPDDLRRAIEEDRALFEHQAQPSEVEPGIAMLRPMADLGLFLAEMRDWESGYTQRLEWVRANEPFRRRVLDLLAESGPMQSRDIPDTAEVAWESTGWTNSRNVTQMLEFLARRGEVAVSGRKGRQRLWDLADRVYPTGVTVVPLVEARRLRQERLLRSLGVARPRIVGESGVAVEIEGVPGPWRLDPEATAEGFAGRTALLSPFDRLIHDRARGEDLFSFEYTLEMYKPQEARRWGYFALPVLHEEAMIGKIDAAADRKASILEVKAVHEDVPWTKPMRSAVIRELDALALWLGLAETRLP